MRFRRLEVHHFRGVDHAVVQFAPGLNVLFGPNDLGKTTLCSAMRAALLLPAESSAHQAFLPWHSSQSPAVSLEFEAAGQRWRVSKTFGARASALLEGGPEGGPFREEERGRAVDRRVRELLRWGIEAPGGRGTGRGLPESFLSQLLLGAQGEVVEILSRTLTGDRDASGRERLHEALSAMAQDPVFQRVLLDVQAKVESAFTPTGRRRTGQSSPFAVLRQNILELTQELERAAHQRRESEDVQKRILLLSEQRLEAEARVASLRERLGEERAALGAAEAQRGVRQRAAAAEQALGALRRAEADLRRLERELEAARGASLLAEDSARTAAAARSAAEADAERSEAALRELSSDASRQALTERASALGSERERLEARVRQLRKWCELERAVEAAAAAQEGEAAALRQAEAVEGELSGKLAVPERELREVRRLEAALRWREARQAALRALAARNEAEELLQRAGAARARAEALTEASSPLAELSPGVLTELRRLERQLREARARLDVGLSVVLQLPRGQQARIFRDGASPTTHAADARPLVARAQSQVRVQLGEDLGFVATAGDPELRAQAEQLERSWAAQTEQLFAAAQVESLDALADRAELARAQHRKAEAALAEAAALEARARERSELVAEHEQWQARAEERWRALEGAEPDALERELVELGTHAEAALSRRAARAEAEQRRLQAALVAETATRARLGARVAAAAQALELACAARLEARAELEAGGGREFPGRAEVEREVGALEQRAAALVAELQEQERAYRARLDASERARELSQAALSQARAREEASGAATRDARERELSLRVQLEERQRLFDPGALSAAELEWEQARAEVARLPELLTVTPGQVVATQAELERAGEHLNQLLAELRRAEGALGQVGGDVVLQRERQTQEALERARELERELERDYDAYRLLAETLRSVENEQGAHLGRALSEPVSQRFQRLTAGRYGRIGLDRSLGFEGIAIAGQPRAYRELSEGTQEQLATILRLCIAEQLQTALVLDDHLAQTHRERAAWFRSALRQSAERIQIIVLTARPEDYLSPEELCAAAQAPEGASASLSVVDLERAIRRAEYAS